MKKTCRKIFAFIMVCTLAFGSVMPAWANSATDEVGGATTLYQNYINNGAIGQQRIQTNVPGQSPAIENYLGQVLDLTTRLVPFSYDASLSYTQQAAPTMAGVTFRNREWNDLNTQVQNMVSAVVQKAKNTCNNDYEMLQWFNSYLVDNCVYDADAIENPDQYTTAYTAYGCLVSGQATCEGYTNAMMLLCREAKIPCIKVTGMADGGKHIWNAVYLNDKWWMLDVTFNDPLGQQSATDRWRFFLLDMDSFQNYGHHSFSQANFLLSKQIFNGSTVGQSQASLPYAGVSTIDARKGDIAYPENTAVPPEESTTTEQPEASGNQPEQSSPAAAENNSDATVSGTSDSKNEAEETNAPQATDASVAQQQTPADTTEKTVEKAEPYRPADPDNLTLEDKANLLKEQGLFMGDERGFRLDEPMTRVEMGVMVMRMNHGQKELAAASQFYADNCPFRDVPQWAKSTIGYLYAKHLSAGISETAFGTGNVTKQDYAVMMLRVLKVEHTYADALQIALDRALLTEEMAAGDKTATRGDIVYMTFATLEQINSVAIPQP